MERYRNYRNGFNTKCDKLLLTIIGTAAIGTFIIAYQSNRNQNTSDNIDFKPSIEAIIVKEDYIFNNKFSKPLPGHKSTFYDFSGNFIDSYAGKRNM